MGETFLSFQYNKENPGSAMQNSHDAAGGGSHTAY